MRFDYEDTDIPQPPDYTLDSVPLPAIFGSAVFGTATFGASNDPMVRQPVEGSGNTVSFRITSTDTKAPYAVNGLYMIICHQVGDKHGPELHSTKYVK